MSKYRIDVMYYGKVEYQYEYEDLQEAIDMYWDRYHNAYGAVNFYVDDVIKEKKELKEIVGNVPRQFSFPIKQDTINVWYPNHHKKWYY